MAQVAAPNRLPHASYFAAARNLSEVVVVARCQHCGKRDYVHPSVGIDAPDAEVYGLIVWCCECVAADVLAYEAPLDEEAAYERYMDAWASNRAASEPWWAQ
jgi:hypothetical protein